MDTKEGSRQRLHVAIAEATSAHGTRALCGADGGARARRRPVATTGPIIKSFPNTPPTQQVPEVETPRHLAP